MNSRSPRLRPSKGRGASPGATRVPLTIHDAEHVIWVPRPLGEGAAAPEARHAYRFNPEGREIVIDGSSGRVLHERDHRIK